MMSVSHPTRDELMSACFAYIMKLSNPGTGKRRIYHERKT
jgi:hypothetical protein